MSRAGTVCRLLFHRIPMALAALLLGAGVTINATNVVARYAFKAAFYWAEEAMIYLSIWSIFVAAIAVAYDRADLTMDFFSARLAIGWRRAGEALIALTTIGIGLFMAWQSLGIMRTLIRNDQRSLALEVPMFIPQAALPICFVLIAAAVGARFLLRLDDAKAQIVSEQGAQS